MSENENKEYEIERAFNTDALSSFNCGIRELDQLIHKKNGGLASYILNNECDFYFVKKEKTIVAIFVFSHNNITIKEAVYDSLEIDFLAVRDGYWKNGIGTKIIGLAEENARQSEFSFLTVDAFFNRKYDASGFYEKNGFEKNNECLGVAQNVKPMYKVLI